MHRTAIPSVIAEAVQPSLAQPLTITYIKDIYEITGGPLITGLSVPICKDITEIIKL